MQTAKTLTRLGRCPGWSESSLGAHSFCWFCHVAPHIFIITKTAYFKQCHNFGAIFVSPLIFLHWEESYKFLHIFCVWEGTVNHTLPFTELGAASIQFWLVGMRGIGLQQPRIINEKVILEKISILYSAGYPLKSAKLLFISCFMALWKCIQSLMSKRNPKGGVNRLRKLLIILLTDHKKWVLWYEVSKTYVTVLRG